MSDAPFFNLFKRDGCLRFPDCLLIFDPANDRGGAVGEHLRVCPRCLEIFEHIAQTGAPQYDPAADGVIDITALLSLKGVARIFGDNGSIRTRIAASGGNANDTAEYMETLPNNWKCTIIYRGGGKKTTLKIEIPNSGGRDAGYPVLEAYQLAEPSAGGYDKYCAPAQDAAFSYLEKGQPVYELDGGHNTLLLIPGESVAMKIFTIDYYRKTKKTK